ncbi:MAG TPA: tRNA (N6-isopentenyl adenosine(37)-C2)-methylthiotransferase MiaB [Williamwhitmania sp.]|nr:tRNA (N6-isopentenyl adenosine(37)-C2)-methylthiotransferase MiaB [Williamwhitmania sp.]
MKYHLLTLGCQMNTSDGERVRAVLEREGFSETLTEDDADILGILACSVRQKPIDKVYNKIAEWNRAKNHRNLITFISGCVLPADREKFLKLFDFVFPMSELNQLPEMIRGYGVATPASLKQQGNSPILPNNENIYSLWNIRPKYSSGFEAYVPIQNGCDKMCTFCAVPYTRGREVSRPSAEILDEVEQLVKQGYKAITLLGQNVNSYGLDKPNTEISFAELLEKIGQLGDSSHEEFWVYFTSPHPSDMDPKVFEVIAQHRCLAKQIHLPLQSGDEKLLIHMNRRHDVETYRELVAKLRASLPQATLFTDIIVGFCGETEEQFQNTVEAFKEFRFNMAYIAQYSPRPGAASYRWDDDVPFNVKKERHLRLTEVLKRISLEHNLKLVGQTVKVLVTGTEQRTPYLTGYTEGRLVTRILATEGSLIGKIITVRITTANELSLAGEPLLVTTAITA